MWQPNEGKNKSEFRTVKAMENLVILSEGIRTLKREKKKETVETYNQLKAHGIKKNKNIVTMTLIDTVPSFFLFFA